MKKRLFGSINKHLIISEVLILAAKYEQKKVEAGGKWKINPVDQ